MKRGWKALVALLLIQTGVAAAAATLEWTLACGACRAGGWSLGLPGAAFYAGLFLAAIFTGPSRLVYIALLFGFGVHVMLVAQLVSTGLVCWLCFGAGAVSLILVCLSVALEPANFARAALVLPWSVLFVLGWSGIPGSIPPPGENRPGTVRILVYNQADCPYCEEFRDRVLPVIEREFGSRVEVVHRPAQEFPAIRKTPTVIVSPSGRNVPRRVFEGMPTVNMLRRAIRTAEEPS